MTSTVNVSATLTLTAGTQIGQIQEAVEAAVEVVSTT